MPRKERADKGLTRDNYQGIARRRTPDNTGRKYTIKPIEPRGKQAKEAKIHSAFWRRHTMEDALTWSEAELEEKLNAFFDAYEARQIKAHGYTWWYPEDPKNRIIDLRYNK